MTALSIVDAIHERVGNGIHHLKKSLVPSDRDEEDSGVSNDSTTASSVCNSIHGQEDNKAATGLKYEEKRENGKLSNGAATVNGKVQSANGLVTDGRPNEKEADFILFNVPSLRALEFPVQAEFLLLAWALLVFRNTENGDDAAFTWSSSNPVESSSNQSEIPGGTGSSPVSKSLDKIREVRDDSSKKSEASTSDELRMFYGTPNASTDQNTKVLSSP